MFRVIQKKPRRIRAYYAGRQTVTGKRHEIALFVLFIAGILIGTITIRKSSSTLLQRLLSLFENYCEVKNAQSMVINFCNSIFRQAILLLAAFCFGLCAVGVPFIYLIALVSGSGIGLIGAYLYKVYALKGIGYCALILYPGRVLTLGGMLYAGAAAAGMSGTLMQGLLKKENENAMGLQTYCKRFLTAAAVSTAAALMESALYGIFSRYFQFS